jgi:O-methyltransferase involved in polyketide biosynthesis
MVSRCARRAELFVAATLIYLSLSLHHNYGLVGGSSINITQQVNKGVQTSNSSTIKADKSTDLIKKEAAAAAVGVRPPLRAPRWVYKVSRKIERVALRIVNLFDPCKPPDSKLSLSVLWWKALSANDPNSPVYDDFLTHDMLPGGFRVFVGRTLGRFYPRLLHPIIEIRTAYLDRTVTSIVQQVRARDALVKVRLVSLGGGYDVRSMKFRERGLIDRAIELDLPQVIDAKTRILQSKRFRKRRPHLVGDMLPEFFPVDLNQLDRVQAILEGILRNDSKSQEKWHTIFLFEGVMLYLDEGVPSALLGVCRQALETTGQKGSVCFADRLENIPGDDEEIARHELAKHGWDLADWLPKGSKTRHMGYARMD